MSGPESANRFCICGDARIDTAIQAPWIGSVNIYSCSRCLGDPPRPADAEPAERQVIFRADDPSFTGRGPERDLVARGIERHPRSGTAHPYLAVLHGAYGVGKTALALRLGHELSARFTPFYVDLGDWRAGGRVDLPSVMRHVLQGLGALPDWISPKWGGLAGRYQEVAGRRRLVLVLDDVRPDDHIEPLRPPVAESALLATARERNGKLLAQRAVGIDVLPLPLADATEVLRKRTESVRPHDTEEELRQLAVRCEGYPFALHEAADLLCRSPDRSFGRIVEDLDKRLRVEGCSLVESVWNADYAEFGASTARLYRLLPYVPGHRLTLEAAAALLGTGTGDAEDAFDELQSRYLVERGRDRHGTRTVRAHRLVRDHAERCARRHADPGERDEALRRLVTWLRRQAEVAVAVFGRRMTVVPQLSSVPYAPDLRFETEKAAGEWLESERVALYDSVRTAVGLGEDTHAVGLCGALWKHYDEHGNHEQAVALYRLGLESALRLGNEKFEIRMRCLLAQPLWKTGFADEAEEHTRRALETAASVCHGEILHASALEFRGKYLVHAGDTESALGCFARSRALHERLGNPYGIMLQDLLTGRALREAGRPAEAAPALRAALARSERQGPTRVVGRALAQLARVHRDLGRPEGAVAALERAVETERERGARESEFWVRTELAELAERTGDPVAVERHRARLRELWDEREPPPGASDGPTRVT